MWLLAPSKLPKEHKYYGAYPNGFLQRARDLLGVSRDGEVLHVCSGMVRHYPCAGLGRYDSTLDLAPETEPDYLQDAREPLPRSRRLYGAWGACLADPPYSESDAAEYTSGSEVYPNPRELVLNMLDAVNLGRRVGLLHHFIPSIPKTKARVVAEIGVQTGTNSRIRMYTVWERLK